MKWEAFLALLKDKQYNYENIVEAKCPVHDDEGHSLQTYTDRGEIHVRCACHCPEEDILRTLGLTKEDLTEGKKTYEFMKRFKTVDEFEESEMEWLVDGWIPEGQITLLAADGGVGKTTLWCDIAAAISNGGSCILDEGYIRREPKKVLVLTSEDSISKKLKKKLRLAGANMENIITVDNSEYNYMDGCFPESIYFTSPELKEAIIALRPALIIFDPVQGFIPPETNMGSRNAMRATLAPLIPIGEEFKTSFLIVCHSNKRKGASGRDRIADSADLWDISRSVLMAGYTSERGVRYLSNEKNNYAPLARTTLFEIRGDGLVKKCGTSDKRDRDYSLEAMKLSTENRSAPSRDDCRELILETLAQGLRRQNKILRTEAGRSGRRIQCKDIATSQR